MDTRTMVRIAVVLIATATSQSVLQAQTAVYLKDVQPLSIMGQATDTRVIQEHWKTGPAILRGKEFEHSISMGNSGAQFASAIFLNRDFDYFEAIVGIDDRYTGRNQFTFEVLGDGQVLAAARDQSVNDKPVQIRVHIKNVTRLELRVIPIWDALGFVWWGNARFIKGIHSVPALVSPEPNEEISQNTPLVWRPAAGATKYLLELQCEQLKGSSDADNPSRFLVVSLSSNTTVVFV